VRSLKQELKESRKKKTQLEEAVAELKKDQYVGC
jgi:hypothetical protein